jgi:hypothetical protein
MDARNGPCYYAFIPYNLKIISCNWPYYHNSFTNSMAHAPLLVSHQQCHLADRRPKCICGHTYIKTVVRSVDTKIHEIILIIQTRDKNSIEIGNTLNPSILCKASDGFSRGIDKSSSDFFQSITFSEHLALRLGSIFV